MYDVVGSNLCCRLEIVMIVVGLIVTLALILGAIMVLLMIAVVKTEMCSEFANTTHPVMLYALILTARV